MNNEFANNVAFTNAVTGEYLDATDCNDHCEAALVLARALVQIFPNVKIYSSYLTVLEQIAKDHAVRGWMDGPSMQIRDGIASKLYKSASALKILEV